MTSHLDAGVLADYREGQLSRRRSARISAHLAGCARCSSLDAGLAEVSALLASAPTPTMPAHLVARLENTLAAEAAARTASAGGETTAGTGHGAAGTADGAAPGPADEPGPRRLPGPGRRTPDRPARRPQWRTGLLGAAAVIAVILVVGVYGLVKLAGQGGQSGSSASGSSGAARQPNGTPAFASRGTAGSPARHAGPGNTLLPAGKLHLIASGTDYEPGELARQVASVLALPLDQSGAMGPGHLTPASAAPATEDRLKACVTQITGGTPPRLVDQASYQGRPATIIVQAAASGRPQQVWVVGPACSAGHADLIAHTELPGQG